MTDVNHEGFKRTKNARFCPSCDSRIPDNWIGNFPCHQCGERLSVNGKHEVRHANDVIHLATREYHLARLRTLTVERRQSPIRIDHETGAITVKCDTPDCRQYVPADTLKRIKVTLMIDDPERPSRKIPVQRARDLCPHCAALASPGGTQAFLSDSTKGMTRGTRRKDLWVMKDRRSAAEIDPKSYQEMRKRYLP